MLPLVQLTETEIEDIVACVPGGAANVQDIYPLAPLQEGILFHHLMSVEGDPYLLASCSAWIVAPAWTGYVQAIQAVVDRHDILRTAVFWEGLPTPVQVVCRNVPMHIEEIELDPEQGDAAEQLYARFSPRAILPRCASGAIAAPLHRLRYHPAALAADAAPPITS